MGRIMPVFLGFISFSIPAGVLLYWVTTNLWQVGQQRVMMRSSAKEPGRGRPAAREADGSARARHDASRKGGNGKKPVASPPRKRA